MDALLSAWATARRSSPASFARAARIRRCVTASRSAGSAAAAAAAAADETEGAAAGGGAGSGGDVARLAGRGPRLDLLLWPPPILPFLGPRLLLGCAARVSAPI